MLRPLGYSLLIHIFVFVGLFAWLSKRPDKPSVNAIKITLSSLSAPTPKQSVAAPYIKIPIPLQQPTIPKLSKTVSPAVQTPLRTPIPANILPLTSPTAQKTPLAAASSTVPVTAEIHKSAPLTMAPPLPSYTPPLNNEKEFLDAHLGEIRSLLIQNLKYPRNAQRLKMQGEVRVSFRLKSDGSVENIEVIHSSGFEILDEDARALIKNTSPQFPKPSKSLTLSVPLSYVLR